VGRGRRDEGPTEARSLGARPWDNTALEVKIACESTAWRPRKATFFKKLWNFDYFVVNN